MILLMQHSKKQLNSTQQQNTQALTVNTSNNASISTADEMKRYTRELSNLSDIKKGIADLEKAIIQNANNRMVMKDGVVVTRSNTKIPLMLKIAIYIIALYSFIMIIKEMYPIVTEFISEHL